MADEALAAAIFAERLGARSVDEPISTELGFDRVFEGACGAQPFRVLARYSHDSTPPANSYAIVVSLKRCVTDARVSLRREGSVDRIGKRLRLNREHQTGDSAFDAAVYVDTDAHDDTLARLLQPAVRAMVMELLTLPIDEIVLAGSLRFGGAADVQWSDEETLLVVRTQATASVASPIEEIPSRLAALATAVLAAHSGDAARPDSVYRAGPVQREPASMTPRVQRSGGVAVFWLIVACWVIAIGITAPLALNEGLRGLQVLAALFFEALFAVVFGWLLRGRPNSVWLLIASLVALNLAPTILGFELVAWINAEYAPAGETTIAGEVRIERLQHSKGYVTVLVAGGERTVLNGSAADRFRSNTNTPVRVVFRQGALGARWIVRLEPSNPSVPPPR